MTKKAQSTKPSKTSKQWLKRHFDDPYVKKSWESKYRSRASFKLLEIQEKDRIIKPCMKVVDLGAAPGSWSQVVQSVIGSKGKIFALDILPMDPINDVSIITGDFTNEAVLKQLEDELGGEKVDLVLSDMAPNLSGHKSVDQPKAIYLNELALDFAINHLKPGGDFLCKVFQGVGSQDFHKALRDNFAKVITRKPKASRDSSTEIYLLSKGLNK